MPRIHTLAGFTVPTSTSYAALLLLWMSAHPQCSNFSLAYTILQAVNNTTTLNTQDLQYPLIRGPCWTAVGPSLWYESDVEGLTVKGRPPVMREKNMSGWGRLDQVRGKC